MTWQPIETAPKDGTCILLHRRWPNGWNERISAFWDAGGWVVAGGEEWELPETEVSFTAWMPLPEPPKEEGR